MGIEFIVGTKSKLELVSATHGAVRVALAQSFDYTPAFDERRIFEFDSDDAVAVVTNFNGVEIRFDHFDTESKLVDAAVNDVDPAGTVILDDPANYQDLTVFLNIRKKSNDKIFQSVLVKGARINGAASTEPVREESVISRSGVATNVFRIKAAALEYNRILLAGSSAFAQGLANSQSDKTATLNVSTYEVTTDNTPQIVVAKSSDLDGKAIVHALKNGAETSVVTLTGSTIEIPQADFGANDVFEVWTTFLDV